MEYSVEYDPAEKMIVATISGKTELLKLRAFGKAIIHLAKRENCFHILTDMRHADLHVSVLEIFNLPQTLAEIAKAQELDISAFKRAFVALKEQDILDFYETVSRNRSHLIKLFFDMEEAKNWLRG
ncbi:MAG: hypothetical protein U0V02_18840 [Anaerolineales bacterium]